MDSPENEPLPPLIRACWAIVLGALGFLTGAIAVSVFSDLPGVTFPKGTSLWGGSVLGLGCLVAGYAYSEKTLDALGDVWQVLWQLSVGILATIPWLLEGQAQLVAGYLAAGAIVAVGFFAPMDKDLLS